MQKYQFKGIAQESKTCHAGVHVCDTQFLIFRILKIECGSVDNHRAWWSGIRTIACVRKCSCTRVLRFALFGRIVSYSRVGTRTIRTVFVPTDRMDFQSVSVQYSSTILHFPASVVVRGGSHKSTTAEVRLGAKCLICEAVCITVGFCTVLWLSIGAKKCGKNLSCASPHNSRQLPSGVAWVRVSI